MAELSELTNHGWEVLQEAVNKQPWNFDGGQIRRVD